MTQYKEDPRVEEEPRAWRPPLLPHFNAENFKGVCGVYFVQMGYFGPIKVGRAQDIWFRLQQLQPGNPFTLRLLAADVAPDLKRPGGVAYWLRKREDHYHQLLRHHRANGEWFYLTEEVFFCVLAVRRRTP